MVPGTQFRAPNSQLKTRVQVLAPLFTGSMNTSKLPLKCMALPQALPGFWSNRIGGHFCFPSKLPYDVTPEQALAHEEVKTRLDNSIRNMRAVTDKFLCAIISSVDKIP